MRGANGAAHACYGQENDAFVQVPVAAGCICGPRRVYAVTGIVKTGITVEVKFYGAV